MHVYQNSRGFQVFDPKENIYKKYRESRIKVLLPTVCGLFITQRSLPRDIGNFKLNVWYWEVNTCVWFVFEGLLKRLLRIAAATLFDSKYSIHV